MNTKLGFAIATLAGTALMVAALHKNSSLSAQPVISSDATYIGLWEGIDEVDGGHSLRSILSHETGFKVLGRDTWHGPCGYGDPAVGRATVSAESNALVGTMQLDCLAGETAETGDRVFAVRYTLDPATQTLTETFLDPETNQPLDRPPIVFFRRSLPTNMKCD